MYIICIDTHLCKSSHGQISTFYNTFKTAGGHDVVNNNHVVKESFCETYYLCKINHDQTLFLVYSVTLL